MKLRTLHEVVVRNRLEQLRKRQRDEALIAQEELLAGVANSASSKSRQPNDNSALDINPEKDEKEEYRRSMSPALVDLSSLPSEDQELELVKAEDDLRSLVGYLPSLSNTSLFNPLTVQTTPRNFWISIRLQSCPRGRRFRRT